MYSKLIQRLLSLIPTAILGTIVIFSIVQITPGGPAYAIAGQDATPEFVAQINHELGLDRPLLVQYTGWLWNLAQGSLGNSLVSAHSVIDLISSRMPVTAILGAEALILSILVGIPLGIIAAIYSGGLLDGTIRGFSGMGLALPEFWVGMLGVNLFALQLFWLPPTGFISPSVDLVGHLRSAALPVVTLALGPIAIFIRFTRSAMVEALEGAYVRTAWSLGLSPIQIYLRFALKNALSSIITIMGIIAAVLMGGTVLIESVFAIPGLGQLLVTSVIAKDFPVVQGVTLALLVIVIIINLCVDLMVAAIDPRTR